MAIPSYRSRRTTRPAIRDGQTRILRYDAIRGRAQCGPGTGDRQDPLAAGDSKDVGGGTDRNEPDGAFYS